MSEERKSKVILVGQDYEKARSSMRGIDELELICAVVVSNPIYDTRLEGNGITDCLENVRKEAEKCGATHVFGLKFTPTDYNSKTIISGDAYGPRNQGHPYRDPQ